MSALYYINVTIHVLAAMLWLGGMFFLGAVGAPVLRAIEPTRGQIQMRVADGSVVDLGQVPPRELRALRREMQSNLSGDL